MIRFDEYVLGTLRVRRVPAPANLTRYSNFILTYWLHLRWPV